MKQQDVVFREKQITQVRDYWNARLRNVRHFPRPVGSKEYFDEVEARQYSAEPHIPLLAEFPRWTGKRVIETGCGKGADTISFARAIEKVAAVGRSDKSIDLARRRAEIFGLADRITFHAADAERLSEAVTPKPHGLVYSFGMIHHTAHPERVIREVRRHSMHPEREFRRMVANRNSRKVLWIALADGKGAFGERENGWRLRVTARPGPL